MIKYLMVIFMNENSLYEEALKQKDKDFLQIGTAFDGTVRIYIAKTTNIVKEAAKVHQTYPTATAALGRALTITLIMGAMLKGDQSIAVKVEGNGPIGKIVCESDTSGRVMGYLQNGGVYIKYKNGHLDVGDAVGREGFITVVKDLHLKEPFTSSVPIISGEIAEDFTYYFAESEQVPSSVSLGVLVGLNEEVLSAGGFVVQVMPNCKEETIAKLEENLKKIPSATELFTVNTSATKIAKYIIGEDEDYNVLKTSRVRFACTCSKDRFRSGIKSLGYAAISKMLKEDKGIEATCQYCHKSYMFEEKEVQEILDEIKK